MCACSMERRLPPRLLYYLKPYMLSGWLVLVERGLWIDRVSTFSVLHGWQWCEEEHPHQIARLQCHRFRIQQYTRAVRCWNEKNGGGNDKVQIGADEQGIQLFQDNNQVRTCNFLIFHEHWIYISSQIHNHTFLNFLLSLWLRAFISRHCILSYAVHIKINITAMLIHKHSI